MDLELPLPAVVVASVEDTVLCDGLKPYRYNRFDILKYSRPMFIFAQLFLAVPPLFLPPSVGDSGGSSSSKDAVKFTTDCLWLQLMDPAREKLFGRKSSAEADSLDKIAALVGRFGLVSSRGYDDQGVLGGE